MSTQAQESPVLKVDVELFKGTIERISYMKTKHEIYKDIKSTQDAEPRYTFTRQENGKYKGEEIQGSYVVQGFGGHAPNATSRIIGEFTLDEINQRISAFKEPIILAQSGRNRDGNRLHEQVAHEPSSRAKLQTMIGFSKAIAAIPNTNIEKLRAGLLQPGVVDRLNAGFELYDNAKNNADKDTAISAVYAALATMQDHFSDYFSKNQSLAPRIKAFLRAQLKENLGVDSLSEDLLARVTQAEVKKQPPSRKIN